MKISQCQLDAKPPGLRWNSSTSLPHEAPVLLSVLSSHLSLMSLSISPPVINEACDSKSILIAGKNPGPWSSLPGTRGRVKSVPFLGGSVDAWDRCLGGEMLTLAGESGGISQRHGASELQ